MKNLLRIMLTIWLALSLTACGAPAATVPSTTLSAASDTVTFSDPVLEAGRHYCGGGRIGDKAEPQQ